MNYETNKMGLPDLSKKKFTERLPLLFSARIRLDDKQRETLKTAWRDLRDSQRPAEATQIPGSTIKTSTAFNLGNLNSVTALTVGEILGSRESIHLTTILSLQAELGVEVVSRSYVEDKFKNYLDYLFTTAESYVAKE